DSVAPREPLDTHDGPSLSELLDEDLSIPDTRYPLDDGLSISDLLDENLTVPHDQAAEEDAEEQEEEPEQEGKTRGD
ncbi:MAG: hypothetical protein M3159_05620, partial [Actinomycetota bacterium]|nr:hypothetical protein [Actinomycetota bacterium]